MPNTKPSGNSLQERRAYFKAALTLAEMTLGEWCVANEITQGHLDKVLRGTRLSPPLIERVDAFIEKHVPAYAA